MSYQDLTARNEALAGQVAALAGRDAALTGQVAALADRVAQLEADAFPLCERRPPIAPFETVRECCAAWPDIHTPATENHPRYGARSTHLWPTFTETVKTPSQLTPPKGYIVSIMRVVAAVPFTVDLGGNIVSTVAKPDAGGKFVFDAPEGFPVGPYASAYVNSQQEADVQVVWEIVRAEAAASDCCNWRTTPQGRIYTTGEWGFCFRFEGGTIGPLCPKLDFPEFLPVITADNFDAIFPHWHDRGRVNTHSAVSIAGTIITEMHTRRAPMYGRLQPWIVDRSCKFRSLGQFPRIQLTRPLGDVNGKWGLAVMADVLWSVSAEAPFTVRMGDQAIEATRVPLPLAARVGDQWIDASAEPDGAWVVSWDAGFPLSGSSSRVMRIDGPDDLPLTYVGEFYLAEHLLHMRRLVVRTLRDAQVYSGSVMPTVVYRRAQPEEARGALLSSLGRTTLGFEIGRQARAVRAPPDPSGVLERLPHAAPVLWRDALADQQTPMVLAGPYVGPRVTPAGQSIPMGISGPYVGPRVGDAMMLPGLSDKIMGDGPPYDMGDAKVLKDLIELSEPRPIPTFSEVSVVRKKEAAP